MAEALELGLDIRKIIKDLEKLERKFEKDIPGAMSEAEDAIDDFEKTSRTSTTKVVRDLDKMTREMDEFGDEAEDAFKQGSEGIKKFQRALDGMQGQLKRISNQLGMMTGKVGGLGRGLVSLKSAAVGLAAGWSVKEFVMFGAEYERSLSKLNAITGKNEKSNLILRKAIRETGATTEFSAKQAAEAAVQMASMGMTAEETAGNLQMMVAASQALQHPIEEVSRIIRAQQNIWGLSSKKIADTLAGAYTTTAATVEKLDVAFRMVGDGAKLMGLSFDEVVGSLAFMIDRGATAERAGTALRAVMARLQRPTKIAVMQMEALGLKFDDIKDMNFEGKLRAVARAVQQVRDQGERATIMMNLFEQEAAGTANTLMEGFMEGKDVISDMAEQVSTATTAMDTAKDMTDDLLGSVRNLRSAVEDRLLEAFQLLEPIIKDVVDHVTGLVRSLTNQDMREGIRSVVIGLASAGQAFYNIIANAVNGIAALIHSGQMQRILATGGKVLEYFVGKTPQAELSDQRALVEQLEAAVAADKKEWGELGSTIAGGINDGIQFTLEQFGTKDLNLGAFTDYSNARRLEEERAKLKEMEAKAGVGGDNEFKPIMPTTDFDLRQYLEDIFDKHEMLDGLKGHVTLADMSGTGPGGANITYGNKSGVALDRSNLPKQKKGGGGGGSTEVDLGNIPPHIANLIPDIEAFKKLSEEHQKQVLAAMIATKELSEGTLRYENERANAHALIVESARIQAEQMLKPALMQQTLVDNLERVGELYEEAENNVELMVGLERERLHLNKQFDAAISAGQGDFAQQVDAQLKTVEGMLSGIKEQAIAEAKLLITEQQRVEDAERLLSVMEALNDIDATDQKAVDKNYLKVAEVAEALAQVEADEQGRITAERRAQLDALWKALQLTEKTVKAAEEGARINLAEKWFGDLKKRLGILGEMMNNPEGFATLGRDLAQGAKDAYQGFQNAPKGKGMEAAGAAMQGAMEAAPGGPKAMAANAIMKLVEKLDVFNAAIELTLGNAIKMLNAIFLPLTTAMNQVNQALEPVWEALGELVTVLFEAFTPLKPLVAVIKGFARIFTGLFKGLANGLRPLTHAMNQLTSIIESIFGGFGGSFGSKIEDLESALETVRGALADLQFGDMNPADAVTKLNEATSEYEKLRKKAFSNNATEEDINKFTEFANTYLSLSQEVNKSSSQYVKDFEKVKGDLTGLEGKIVTAIEGADEDPTGIGKWVEAFIGAIIKAAEKFAEAIVQAVKQLLQGAINLLAWIAQAIIDKIREALQGAWDLLTQIAGAIWDAITKALTGAWDLLTGIATAVWDTIVNALQGTWNMLSQLAEAVWGVVEGFFQGSIGSFLQQLLDTVWGVVQGMFGGDSGNLLSNLVATVWDAVKGLFEGYFSLMEQFYQLIWDILKGAFEGYITFWQILYDAVAGAIKQGFTAAWNFVELVWNGISNALTTGFDQAFNFVAALTEEVVKALKSGFEQYVNFITSLYEEVGKALARGFSGAVNFITELFEQVVAKLAEGFTGYVNFLKTFYKEVFDALAKGFDQAWNFFSALVSEVVNALKRGFDQQWNFLQDMLSNVVGALQRGFSGYISFWNTLFTEVTNALSRGFAGYVSFLQKIVSEVTRILSDAFGFDVSFLSELFNNVSNALVRGFSGTISFIQNMIDGVTTFIQKGLSGSFDFAGVVMSKIGEMLRGGKNLLQLILDKIMTALGLKGQSDTIPILPNPLRFLGGPENFLELEYSFAKGGQAPSAHGTSAFKSGGLATGPSHQSGMLGLSKSGDPFLFEGKEFIINKKTTELLGSGLLGRINDIKSINDAQELFGLGAPQPTFMVPPVFPKNLLSAFEYGGLISDAEITPPPLNKNSKSFDKSFGKKRGIWPQTSGGKGELELLHLNNPLSSLTGPSHWYVKLVADIMNGVFDIKRNIFAKGGALADFLSGQSTIPQFDNGWMMGAILEKKRRDDEAKKAAAAKKVPPAFSPGGFEKPTNPQKSAVEKNRQQYDRLLKAAQKFAAMSETAKLGMGFSGIQAQGGVPLGGTTANPKATKPPPPPHSFQKGMGLKFKGGIGGWPWSKELINIKNPFYEWVTVIVDWVKNWTSLFDWFLDPIYDTVKQVIGPDRLKLSIDGRMLDFWNSRLSANFGGSVLSELGLPSIPLPDFLNVDLDEGWKSQKSVTSEQLNQTPPPPEKPKPLLFDGHLMRRIFPEIWGDEPTSFSKRFGSDANAWIRGLVDPAEYALDGYSMEQFQKDLADAYNYNDKYVLDRDTGRWYERGTTPPWLKANNEKKAKGFDIWQVIDSNIKGAASEVGKVINNVRKVFGWGDGGHLALMASGGLVSGSGHRAGGRAVELEGGEYVMRKEAVRDLGKDALDRLNQTGSGVFERQTQILARIEKAVLASSGNSGAENQNIVVNVYTDLQGQTKLAINEFRTEIKQRASRIPEGSTRETYLPVSVL